MMSMMMSGKIHREWDKGEDQNIEKNVIRVTVFIIHVAWRYLISFPGCHSVSSSSLKMCLSVFSSLSSCLPFLLCLINPQWGMSPPNVPCEGRIPPLLYSWLTCWALGEVFSLIHPLYFHNQPMRQTYHYPDFRDKDPKIEWLGGLLVIGSERVWVWGNLMKPMLPYRAWVACCSGAMGHRDRQAPIFCSLPAYFRLT